MAPPVLAEGEAEPVLLNVAELPLVADAVLPDFEAEPEGTLAPVAVADAEDEDEDEEEVSLRALNGDIT
jgi:hypothetical protein